MSEAKAFFYDIEEITARSTSDAAEEMGLDDEARKRLFAAFGKELFSKRVIATPELSMYVIKVAPGEKTALHRHGTTQLTYVLKGELRYGNRVTGPGQGQYNPNRWYTWTAGPEGCEYIEIHAGVPGMDLKGDEQVQVPANR